MWNLHRFYGRFGTGKTCLRKLCLPHREKIFQAPSQTRPVVWSGRVQFLSTSSCSRSNEPNSASDVRRKFIEYFVDNHQHAFVPSSSVLPADGSGLLFTNAGMNQFKDIIQGTVDPRLPQSKYQRVVNSQKCIRAGGKHNDLEDVGKDTYHHTFFEMLGNWSFGDYFKHEACSMAWDLLTNIYRLPREKLYVTYFGGDEDLGLPPDEEARDIWLSLGVPSHKVLPFGMKDNFWEMGQVGPCGPCSEVHFNRSNISEASKFVNKDHPDILEVWNLVFMEHFRIICKDFCKHYLDDGAPDQHYQEDALKLLPESKVSLAYFIHATQFCMDTRPNGLLEVLPKRHVDTGLGLERLVAILQGKTSNYDTDLFEPLMQAIQQYTGAPMYGGTLGPSDRNLIDTAYRVIADHARMLTVAIADGGQPDYYKRGYVLKRVIRRAVRFASEKLDSPPGLLSHLVPVVIDSLGDTYPELWRDPDHICHIIDREEKQFLKTLKKGQKYLLKTFDKLGSDKVLPGDIAWKMYDGFGFPIDLTTMIAEEHGVSVDMEGYEETRKQTHEITSQGGIKNVAQVSLFALQNEEIASLQKAGISPTMDRYKYNYSGTSSSQYEFPSIRAKILAIKSAENGVVQTVPAGEQCAVILDCTNFYAEQGGQEWDEGVFISVDDQDIVFSVTDTQSYGGYVLHVGEAEKPLEAGMEVELKLDENRRLAIMKNHTATHILNFALREVIQDAEQRGSLVAPDKLRFDFNAKRPLSRKEVVQLSNRCKDIIQSNCEVFQRNLPLETARSIPGIRAMFIDAGHDPACVVSIGSPLQKAGSFQDVDGTVCSVEFCGGTHVTNSEHVGQILITSQKLASGGIRRLTAISGEAALLAQEKAKSLTGEISSYKKQVEGFLRILEFEDKTMMSLQRDLYELELEMDSLPLEIIQKDQMKAEVTGLRENLKKHEKKMKKVLLFKISEEIAHHPNFKKHLNIIKVLPDGIEPRDLRSISAQCQRKRMKSSLMLLSKKGSKVFGLCISSKEMIVSGFSALGWAKEISSLVGGNCSGNEYSATIIGHSEKKLEDITELQS